MLVTKWWGACSPRYFVVLTALVLLSLIGVAAVLLPLYLQTVLGHGDPFALISDYCGISRVTASSTGIRTLRSVNETAHLRHLP